MAKLKKVNIVSSIIAMLIISISGIGTYAFKGLLADIKTQAAKVKAEVFKELENYYKVVRKEIFKELENYYETKIKNRIRRNEKFNKRRSKKNYGFHQHCKQRKLSTRN